MRHPNLISANLGTPMMKPEGWDDLPPAAQTAAQWIGMALVVIAQGVLFAAFAAVLWLTWRTFAPLAGLPRLTYIQSLAAIVGLFCLGHMFRRLTKKPPPKTPEEAMDEAMSIVRLVSESDNDGKCLLCKETLFGHQDQCIRVRSSNLLTYLREGGKTLRHKGQCPKCELPFEIITHTQPARHFVCEWSNDPMSESDDSCYAKLTKNSEGTYDLLARININNEFLPVLMTGLHMRDDPEGFCLTQIVQDVWTIDPAIQIKFKDSKILNTYLTIAYIPEEMWLEDESGTPLAQPTQSA